MSIEAGARAGLIAPDQKTFDYIKGKPHAPEDFPAAQSYWQTLFTDSDAKFDVEITLNADELEPFVTWGTNPGQGLPLNSVFQTQQISRIQRREELQSAHLCIWA